ncbi:MAG: hypothetical protein R3293_14660 [Candidatus Promineifilaceae bacterium]|nr:hypothetical protein [Candidatus Promineifilaceae bacterium]
MSDRKYAPLWVTLIGIVVVAAAVALGWRLLRGDNSLLRHVEINAQTITPNADGVTDAALLSYELSRNATVSIYFENETGDRFYFRKEKPRGTGEYQVLFSGIVDGYTLPDDEIQGEILSRLLQDGNYTWTVKAEDENGNVETQQGVLAIAEADMELPDLRDFTLDYRTFTPNRDGISDRVKAQFYLAKEVDEVRVFLRLPDGSEVPISELERDIPAKMPGRHVYDYEGGVDNGATPPPDGTYPIIAEARDLEGQIVRVEDTLTIQYGGVPRADIFAPPAGDTLELSTTAVTHCDTITVTMTVENYGTTPIRTTGPVPGTVYDSDWNYNTLGWHTESGAWRAAIGFENELTNYPFRWAVGNPEDLEEIDGNLYLMPGQRAVITGGIRVVGTFGDRNPQPMWAGLIHEDVEISQFNNRVDPHAVLVDLADEANLEPCAPRDIPHKDPNS